MRGGEGASTVEGAKRGRGRAAGGGGSGIVSVPQLHSFIIISISFLPLTRTNWSLCMNTNVFQLTGLTLLLSGNDKTTLDSF